MGTVLEHGHSILVRGSATGASPSEPAAGLPHMLEKLDGRDRAIYDLDLQPPSGDSYGVRSNR